MRSEKIKLEMENEFLRHTLATIKYRFLKSLKYKDEGLGNLLLGKGSRTPAEIINHMTYVINWGIGEIESGFNYAPEKTSKDIYLEAEIKRFIAAIDYLDATLIQKKLNKELSKKLLQGPLSDALTHIGQISMLSRFNNKPIEKEDFSEASINIPGE